MIATFAMPKDACASPHATNKVKKLCFGAGNSVPPWVNIGILCWMCSSPSAKLFWEQMDAVLFVCFKNLRPTETMQWWLCNEMATLASMSWMTLSPIRKLCWPLFVQKQHVVPADGHPMTLEDGLMSSRPWQSVTKAPPPTQEMHSTKDLSVHAQLLHLEWIIDCLSEQEQIEFGMGGPQQ